MLRNADIAAPARFPFLPSQTPSSASQLSTDSLTVSLKIRKFSAVSRSGVIALFLPCHVGQGIVGHRVMIVFRHHFEEICACFLCDHLRDDGRIAFLDHTDRVLLF